MIRYLYEFNQCAQKDVVSKDARGQADSQYVRKLSQSRIRVIKMNQCNALLDKFLQIWCILSC